MMLKRNPPIQANLSWSRSALNISTGKENQGEKEKKRKEPGRIKWDELPMKHAGCASNPRASDATRGRRRRRRGCREVGARNQ